MPLSLRSAVLKTPGVVQIVGLGNKPLPVEASEMEGVLITAKYGLRAEPTEYPQPMDRVLIQFGPLRGLEGVVIERKNQRKIILSLSLLQRAIAVELDQAAVIPVSFVLTE
jgi:transcription antitermination factor NusG